MNSGSAALALGVAALLVATLGLVVAAIAFLRAGGRERLEVLRMKQHIVANQLARSLRESLEDSVTRIKRAQVRLAEAADAAPAALQGSVDELGRQLAQLRDEAEQELVQLRTEISSRAMIAQEDLARRVRYVEANIELMRARGEIAAAEGLAEGGAFGEAEDQLEDAVTRVREVKLRLSDVVGDDPAFAPVLGALGAAIHALRARSRDHKRQLDTVLSASDTLLAWLKSRGPHGPLPAAVSA